MKYFVLASLLATPAAAILNLRKTDACAAEDMKRRMQLQNKLAGDCEEMCKEVGAYPKGCTCPDFVQPDSTPGVMTWDELLAHMDNLVEWGGPRGLLKQWQSQASSVLQTGLDAKACAALDLKHRSQVQNKLASACLDMCKEIGAYPKCECPGFAPPDATPGVMTWEELNEHMDNLVAWGMDMLKKAKARAGSFIQNKTVADVKKTVVAKNQTKAQQTPSYGAPTIVCVGDAFWVKKNLGSWTAVSGTGCVGSSDPFTKAAACGGGGASITMYSTMQDCTSGSTSLTASGTVDSSCSNEKSATFYSYKISCGTR